MMETFITKLSSTLVPIEAQKCLKLNITAKVSSCVIPKHCLCGDKVQLACSFLGLLPLVEHKWLREVRVGKYWGWCEELFQPAKSFLTRIWPHKWSIGSCQHVEWSSFFGEIRHKPPVITCQTKKISHTADIRKGRELLHCQDLVQVRENPLSRNNIA